MKLVLPIAGVGMRLRPFSFSKPKAFVQIGGSRGVDHILNKIGTSLPKKTPICLITGYKSVQIKDYLDKNYAEDFALDYVEQIPAGYQGDVPFFGGLGQAILLSKEWYEQTQDVPTERLKEDYCLVFLSDMIPVQDYQFILDALEDPEVDGVLGTMIVLPEKTQFYGIVETDGKNIIQSMVEKPNHTTSTQAISGVYAFKTKTMKRLYEILDEQHKFHLQEIKDGKKERMEFQFTPSLQQLVEEGFKIKSEPFTEGILDFGRPDALLQANRILLEAHNSHLNGSIRKIEDSVITTPCAIGKGCQIIRSVIGPYVSIGKDCIIEDCNLENIVIGDNCTLKRIISKMSIIGDNVKIDSIIKDNITLGDNSFLLEL